ncbi:GIY-YIG nuclease family protein [Naasia lichenicola]|uniref:GIY-YIG nuclease family protein n=1 Tax=Naasia lichenicola TaxID=2565933 RepID=A0A4S4FG56_9MICO|nr:GIY-YIG nuclease family protein [Naasia lichenicola]THG28742.1 GIY-YIG nuclease family protein [Naasia lichenicola]
MAWTYILECADKSLYIGSTRDLDQRMFDHETGVGAAYTRTRLPVQLVAAFESDTIGEAFEFEKRIQRWSRAKKIALIEGRLDDLNRLNRKGHPPSLVSPESSNPGGRGQGSHEMRRTSSRRLNPKE